MNRYATEVLSIKRRMRSKVDQNGRPVEGQVDAEMKADWKGRLVYASHPDVGTYRLDPDTEDIQFEPAPTDTDE